MMRFRGYYLIISLLSLTGAGCAVESNSTNTRVANTIVTASANTTEPNLAITTLCQTHTASPRLPAGDVMALAKTEASTDYAFAETHGAEIISVDDNKSYAIWWQPEGFDPASDTVLVSLGGHGGWAVKDFALWYPEVNQRQYAFLGLQWWFGRSLESNGYYEPDQIYEIISAQLAEHNITSRNVIFQGFSMSSARSYAITLLDTLCGREKFGVTIANSGQWEDDYNSNKDVLEGTYGEAPYAGTHWILFCGDQDNNEFATAYPHVCDGMTHTQDVLTKYGGTVDLFIKDPDGDHGSFMLNKANRSTALNLADQILTQD